MLLFSCNPKFTIYNWLTKYNESYTFFIYIIHKRKVNSSSKTIIFLMYGYKCTLQLQKHIINPFLSMHILIITKTKTAKIKL